MVKSGSGSGSGWICFINPAKSGSGRISQKQIRYSPNNFCSPGVRSGRVLSYQLDGQLAYRPSYTPERARNVIAIQKSHQLGDQLVWQVIRNSSAEC